MPYLDTFLVIGGRDTEGDSFYDEIQKLDNNNAWVYVEEIYDETSQAGAVYVSESKVLEYGCEYLLT